MKELDRLDLLTRMLRESRTGHHANAGLSKAVILGAFERRRARRMHGLRIIVPLAAVLLGSTAWAFVDGQRRAAVRRWFEEALHPTMQMGSALAVRSTGQLVPPPTAATVEKAPPSTASVLLRPIATPTTSAVSETPASARLPARRHHSGPAVRAAAPPESPQAPASAEDEDNRLYEVAHREHFHGRDLARALSAWDAYLSSMPDGRFSAEARYNRALCLIRLGRANEARTALEPFATGKFGTYRQADARRLLSLLGLKLGE